MRFVKPHAPFALLAALAITTPSLRAAEQPPASTETAAAHDARMAWWREARFGMFIHYGLYSGLEGESDGKSIGGGGVEWYQTRVGLDTDTYAKRALPRFKPSADAAKAWAKLAKDAGCRYVVLTTKHHEGFDLFDSKLTDFDTGDTLKRDLVREYADAVRAEGLKVGFYHSLIDWHHAQYDFSKAKDLPYPKGAIKKAAGETRDQTKYIGFLHDQVVNELLSNYGNVDVLWFDYSSMKFDGDDAWGASKLLADIRAKQPGIIVNNRLYRRPEAGFKGMGTNNISAMLDTRYGDFITPEQHIPANGMPGTDWESCMTLNGTWGYSKYDNDWKSARTLIRNLCDIASKGGNYLLNIGPKGDGSIPQETIERMEAIGAWMKTNGNAIYGTTASPLKDKADWGRITTKGDVIYLHIFERPANGVISIPLRNEVKGARLLAGGETLKTRHGDSGALFISLPERLPDANVSVVELRLDGAPRAN